MNTRIYFKLCDPMMSINRFIKRAVYIWAIFLHRSDQHYKCVIKRDRNAISCKSVVSANNILHACTHAYTHNANIQQNGRKLYTEVDRCVFTFLSLFSFFFF